MLGHTQSEIDAYLALLKKNPVNGSQLSKACGIPRTRIYDVLRGMTHKGMALELATGQYIPLPREELLKRTRQRYEAELDELQELLEKATVAESQEYVWTIRGYNEVMAKSKEMIATARSELYVLLFPEEELILGESLQQAEARGVAVKYVAMGKPRLKFRYQVIHPEADIVRKRQAGRIFDVVKDCEELLVGSFQQGREDRSPFNWARNHWFVVAIREGIRHDFFHYFVHKMLDCRKELSKRDQRLYEMIKNDSWKAGKL